MIPKFKVKSKIRKIFKNHNLLEVYSVRIYKIDPYFYEQFENNIQVDNKEHKYILFKIDIYFSQFFLAIEIDEKRNTDMDLIFEIKRQKALEKKLNCKFIKINARNDLEYEINYIQKFIDEFKNNKIKELENEIKELGDRNNKATDFILKEAKLNINTNFD